MISLVAQTHKTNGRAVVKRLCRTLSIGRSSYYRSRRATVLLDLLGGGQIAGGEGIA